MDDVDKWTMWTNGRCGLMDEVDKWTMWTNGRSGQMDDVDNSFKMVGT